MMSLQPYQAVTVPLITSTFWTLQDVKWMNKALALAKQGAKCGEVPVGALIIYNNTIIGQGFNQPIGCHDATAHAEIIALREACLYLQNYRLPLEATLYVTLEPCTMCIGALIHARVSRLVYAATEPRAGMVGSQMDLSVATFYNHTIQVDKGLCAAQSSQLLKFFFRQRRQQAKKKRSNILS